MATIDLRVARSLRERDADSRSESATFRRRIIFGTVAVLVAIGVGIVLIGQRRPPQMGADERVFHTVDALYTAVKSQDLARLADCERRLHEYKDAGKLPSAAAARLDGVIGTAKSGSWRSAAESLYDFMLGQRREGADLPRAKPVKAPPRRRA